MFDIHSIEYKLFIYRTIIDAINEKLDKPQNYWFKPVAYSEPIGYSHIIKMSDEQIIEFVHTLVLIRGSLNSTVIKGFEYKKITGGRFFLPLDFELKFDSDEEKLLYISFHKHVVGLGEEVA